MQPVQSTINFTNLLFGNSKKKAEVKYEFQALTGCEDSLGEQEVTRVRNAYAYKEDAMCQTLGDSILREFVLATTGSSYLTALKEVVKEQAGAIKELDGIILSVWNEFRCACCEQGSLAESFSRQNEALRVAFQSAVITKRDVFKK